MKQNKVNEEAKGEYLITRFLDDFRVTTRIPK